MLTTNNFNHEWFAEEIIRRLDAGGLPSIKLNGTQSELMTAIGTMRAVAQNRAAESDGSLTAVFEEVAKLFNENDPSTTIIRGLATSLSSVVSNTEKTMSSLYGETIPNLTQAVRTAADVIYRESQEASILSRSVEVFEWPQTTFPPSDFIRDAVKELVGKEYIADNTYWLESLRTSQDECQLLPDNEQYSKAFFDAVSFKGIKIADVEKINSYIGNIDNTLRTLSDLVVGKNIVQLIDQCVEISSLLDTATNLTNLTFDAPDEIVANYTDCTRGVMKLAVVCVGILASLRQQLIEDKIVGWGETKCIINPDLNDALAESKLSSEDLFDIWFSGFNHSARQGMPLEVVARHELSLCKDAYEKEVERHKDNASQVRDEATRKAFIAILTDFIGTDGERQDGQKLESLITQLADNLYASLTDLHEAISTVVIATMPANIRHVIADIHGNITQAYMEITKAGVDSMDKSNMDDVRAHAYCRMLAKFLASEILVKK